MSQTGREDSNLYLAGWQAACFSRLNYFPKKGLRDLHQRAEADDTSSELYCVREVTYRMRANY